MNEIPNYTKFITFDESFSDSSYSIDVNTNDSTLNKFEDFIKTVMKDYPELNI